MKRKRADRVGDQIKEEIAQILAVKARDPRIGFVTVTGVRVSDDLNHAKVYVSVHEKQDVRKTFAALKKARGFVRGQLAQRLPLRRIPDLVFLPDDLEQGQAHLLELHDQIGDQET
ncbi:MAG: 30S ribosome-binding factor RbfA, partial [Nitrospiria bacterium]